MNKQEKAAFIKHGLDVGKANDRVYKALRDMLNIDTKWIFRLSLMIDFNRDDFPLLHVESMVRDSEGKAVMDKYGNVMTEDNTFAIRLHDDRLILDKQTKMR